MALYLGLTSLLVAAAGPAVGFFELAPAMAAFVVYVLGGALGLLAVVAGLLGYLRRKRGSALLGLVLGLVPFLAVAVPAFLGRSHPRINDVTTDLQDPPEFHRAAVIPALHGVDLSYPPEFVPAVREHYPDLETLVVDVPAESALNAAVRVIEEHEGWEITAVDRERGLVEAVATSVLFHFRDDFAVRVRSTAEGKTAIDMRSRSRDGKGDLGINAERIRGFMAALGAELRTPVSP